LTVSVTFAVSVMLVVPFSATTRFGAVLVVFCVLAGDGVGAGEALLSIALIYGPAYVALHNIRAWRGLQAFLCSAT
jgi:hypothetical protein